MSLVDLLDNVLMQPLMLLWEALFLTIREGVSPGLALIAIGQSPLTGLVADLEGIEARDGKLAVDQRGATGRPGVFAGGDCANGGKEVVNAVAEGELAAEGIHEYLKQGGDNA